MKIPVQVNIGKEYKEQVDKLVADMKAYGRKQVWEECTCNNCKWWIMDGWDIGRCDNVLVREFASGIINPATPEFFGCNQWEAKDE